MPRNDDDSYCAADVIAWYAVHRAGDYYERTPAGFVLAAKRRRDDG